MTLLGRRAVSYTSLFPYINQQVGELGIADNEDRVGYYSGVVEAVFAGVQLCVSRTALPGRRESQDGSLADLARFIEWIRS